MTNKQTITDFLLARIAEDEEEAREAEHCIHESEKPLEARIWDYYVVQSEGWPKDGVQSHVAKWWPARVLRECTAKRAIIGAHECSGLSSSPCETLDALAAVYSDHSDYQQEWALNVAQ